MIFTRFFQFIWFQYTILHVYITQAHVSNPHERYPYGDPTRGQSEATPNNVLGTYSRFAQQLGFHRRLQAHHHSQRILQPGIRSYYLSTNRVLLGVIIFKTTYFDLALTITNIVQHSKVTDKAHQHPQSKGHKICPCAFVR